MQDFAGKMRQKLSMRLKAAADFVTPGSHVADVGTDHGHLPIYLVQCGKCPCAIAMDIRKGPLQRAKEHIADAGLDDYIRTRLSDGMQELVSGEADSVVIAGMGGLTVIQILEASFGLVQEMKELILAPQSDLAKVRRFLREHGMVVDRENLVLEDGKFYPILHVVMKEVTTCAMGIKETLVNMRLSDKMLANEAECREIQKILYEKIEAEYSQPEQKNTLNEEDWTQKVVGDSVQFAQKDVSGEGNLIQEMAVEKEYGQEKQVDARFWQIMDRYGEYMVYTRHPMLQKMLERDVRQKQKILQELELNAKGEGCMQRRIEVERQLRDIKILLEIM